MREKTKERPDAGDRALPPTGVSAEDDGSEIKNSRAPGICVAGAEGEAMPVLCARPQRSVLFLRKKPLKIHAVALVTEEPVTLECHVAPTSGKSPALSISGAFAKICLMTSSSR